MSEEIVPNTTEMPSGSGAEGNSREAIIAAAEAAMGEYPTSELPADAPAARIEVVDAPATPETASSVGNRLAQLLKTRTEENKNRSVYAQKRQEVEREQAELAKHRAEIEAERQRFAKLKKSPIEAFKEIGWGAEDIQRAVLEDGTPEGREKAKYLNELEELRSKHKALEDAIAEQKSFAEQMRANQAQARREQAVKQFLDFTKKEACPNLRYMYDDNLIVNYGDSLAHQYSQKTGKVIAEESELRELSAYMETEAAEKIDQLLYQLHSDGVLQDRLNKVLSKHGKTNGVATKPKANGTHTLRAIDAAQRKTQPQSVEEMSPADLRAYLIAQAEEAMRSQ